MKSMGKQEGSSGVGASMKLFIAAPSSQALAAVSTTLPWPPLRPRGQEYHALTPNPAPNPALVTWKGAGKGVTHLTPTFLPCSVPTTARYKGKGQTLSRE